MTDFIPHSLRRLKYFKRTLFKDLTEEEVQGTIDRKKKHDKQGEHWIVLRKLERVVVKRRGKVHVNGNLLIAVVISNAIKTIMLRRKGQTKKCDYFWE